MCRSDMTNRMGQWAKYAAAILRERQQTAAQSDTARFWQAVCLVLTVAYAAGFIEHYFKGCNV